MAPRASALALDHRAPSLGIARLHRTAIEPVHVTEIRDDAGDFRRVEPEGLHPGARNAGRDDANEILIGDRVAKLSAPEVDAADAIAVGSVAGRALRVVEACAVRDVGRRVFAGVRLSGRLSCGDTRQLDKKQEHSDNQQRPSAHSPSSFDPETSFFEFGAFYDEIWL
jgi:hypothetical protein